jgi:valyl-tRNA synthetase
MGRLRLEQLVTAVCADSLVRYAGSRQRQVTWACATLAGDLAGQYEVDREFARRGQDRSSVPREEFVERVRAAEGAARSRLGTLVKALGVEVDLESGALDRTEVARAARTAFVRLYEEGLLSFGERVVDTCPRCVTAVDQGDADPVDLAEDLLVLRLAGVSGSVGVGGAAHVEVSTVAPELLPAVVAILVPDGHPAVGLRVDIPLGGPTVSVVSFDVAAPRLAVPAHDDVSHDAAHRLGMAPCHLFDPEGVAHHDGPLDGLSRYAARAAARQLLQAEGVIVGTSPGTESVARCRRCRTVLIPRLGHHWMLSAVPLELAAADAVREGQLSFWPPAAREEFLERAGSGGEWCVSYQVLAGQPVPAATCQDCGGLVVTVEPPSSCPRCMGSLSPDLGVLDARFVAAVWPLAAAGWPAQPVDDLDLAATALLVGPRGFSGWALTMAALGLRLTGRLPFGQVIVCGPGAPAPEPEPGAEIAPEIELAEGDLDLLIATEGPEVVRLALLAGGLDVSEARGLAAALVACLPAVQPVTGPDTPAVTSLWAAVDAAFAAGRPGDAFPLLTGALAEGLENGSEADIGVLAGLLLGDCGRHDEPGPGTAPIPPSPSATEPVLATEPAHPGTVPASAGTAP